MNILADYEAHRRDEEYDNSAAGRADWKRLPKCPIHGTPLIIGRGWVDLKTGKTHNEVFTEPHCMDCQP